jgi:hypothetical protein
MLRVVNGEAWQALDHFDPQFARDPKNVRLGLSSDGFQLTSPIVVSILASEFLSCLTLCRPTNV